MQLFDDTSSGPGVRALVIGIGNYPKATGGKFTLPNLGSPAFSAAEFGLWLRDELDYPDRPLKYLDLRISPDPTTKPDLLTKLKDRICQKNSAWTFESCLQADLAKAIIDWSKKFVDSEDVGILFFCGHGVSVDGVTALLCEDFDTSALNFTQSIDLTALHQATAGCRAKSQYFFVDACRTTPSSLVGKKIQPSAVLLEEAGRMHRGDFPIYFGSELGKSSFGLPTDVSQFTDALLRAFQGAGAVRGKPGIWPDWVVSSHSLQAGIAMLLDLKVRLNQIEPQSSPFGDGTSLGAIHRVKTPARLPLYLSWASAPRKVSFKAPGKAPLEAEASPLSSFEVALSNIHPAEMASFTATGLGGVAVPVQPSSVTIEPGTIDYELQID